MILCAGIILEAHLLGKLCPLFNNIQKTAQREPKGVKGTPKGAKGSPKSAQGRTKARPVGAQGDHMEPKIGPVGPNYINKLPINRPSGRYVKMFYIQA